MQSAVVRVLTRCQFHDQRLHTSGRNEGDVAFPLRMEELEIHGERPSVGTEVACHISVLEIQRRRIRVEAEIVRPDGTVWMRIRDWEDWLPLAGLLS